MTVANSGVMTAPISIQLYSLREENARDLPGVLRRLGQIGFVGVETAGLYGHSAPDFRRLVEDAGMVISSTHSGLPVGDATGAILEEQAELGTPMLISGGGPADFATADAVRRTSELWAQAAENAAAANISVGYHNHWWEFESIIDGRPALEAFLGRTDPRVFAEVDTYWVQTAGTDAAGTISSMGPRARLLHLKDGPCIKEQPHVAVGSGAMDIPRVLAAGAGAEWHVVELDACASDMMDAVEASYRYLVGAGLSRGREAVTTR